MPTILYILRVRSIADCAFCYIIAYSIPEFVHFGGKLLPNDIFIVVILQRSPVPPMCNHNYRIIIDERFWTKEKRQPNEPRFPKTFGCRPKNSDPGVSYPFLCKKNYLSLKI
ncbi:hypothetical protein BPAE_0002g00010 [Botrytis paeoniae]|uniref:Uncharacterized protein n=1 Tax=Botrytis paeoniae TaxID=278948 RepID=A0A4Z1G9V5_9HELO|nr:hypothetical protein BPAE_0002g00010 [Botrytis paeoniae]